MSKLPNKLQEANILVVDDNQTNVMLLKEILSVAGYRNVMGETDSRNVKGIYQTGKVDLILLDIRMPHLDGFEVMEQLSEIAGEDYLPILVLTAQTDNETKLRALERGAKDFLHKPFDHLEALNRIRNMLEVRLLHNQVREQNRELDEQVRIRTDELNQTRLEVIRRLGRAAEYRDNETGMHVIRMSHACARLGASIGLDGRACDLLLNASPMHDVGKIGIPDNILLKPGALDSDEWEIMKTHTTIGGEILGEHESELMDMARIVALTHHEKWDGTGYPYGLKGEEIPLFGRITAVCDVFDALTSDRPYKKAWPVEEAVSLIQENTGKQFDPELVVKFLEILPDVLAIREQYADVA